MGTVSDDPRNARTPSAADLVVEELALSEAALLEANASLRADITTYRALCCQALATVHDVTLERDQLRAQNHRLIDELRALQTEPAA